MPNTPRDFIPDKEDPLLAKLLPVDVTHLLGNEMKVNDALPGLDKNELTALLLDVNNLYSCARENGFAIDYGKLRQMFAYRCNLRYCAAFFAVDHRSPGSEDWLKAMEGYDYTVFTKPIKQYFDGEKQVVKGNMDVDITITAMSLSSSFSHIIIGTCDGDFTPLVKKLKEDPARKVSILAMNGPARTTDKELINVNREDRPPDHFYDLIRVRDHIEYKGRSR